VFDFIRKLKGSQTNGWIVGLFKKPAPALPYESDRQMLARVARQFLWLFVILFFFEDLLDFAVEIVHSVFEILHLLIEFIEGYIEEILEHLLHTDHHQSETIIVNAILLIGLYGFYRLVYAFPGLVRRLKINSYAACLKYKRRKLAYWQALLPKQKIKLTAAYLAGLALLLFWLTL